MFCRPSEWANANVGAQLLLMMLTGKADRKAGSKHVRGAEEFSARGRVI
jgi:hypothetical protein